MKSIKLLIAFLIIGSSTGFAQVKNIDVKNSTVKWTGTKVSSSHYGNIKIKKGNITFDNGNIKSGEVVMDMNSITNTDLEGGSNKRLVGHLKSDDFFGVETYPTATLKITKATAFTNGKSMVSGKITIKENSEYIKFEVTKKGNSYTTQLNVNRSKFDVRYGSDSFFDNLGNKAISDIFTLDIELTL